MEKWFKSELIKRAQQGDAEAGREILKEIVLAIDANRFDPLLFPFLAECLGLFLQDGIQLDRALCVEAVDQGGRPPKTRPARISGGRYFAAGSRWAFTRTGC